MFVDGLQEIQFPGIDRPEVFAMTNRIIQPLLRDLALVACSVPDLTEEGVPRRTDGLMVDSGCAPTIAELKKIRAVPRYGIEFVLVWVEIIRCSL